MDEAARHCAAMMETMHGAHGAAGGDSGAGWMMGMGGMGGMGGMLAGGLLWVLIIVIVIALLVVGGIWLLRRREPAGTSMPAQTARQTLDHRYAAGELDRETYLQMRSDLEVSG